MDFPAKITSKGQVTLPAAVRYALGLRSGDRVVFSVTPERPANLVLDDSADAPGAADPAPSATMTKAPDFFALAGSVPTPPRWRDADWPTIREEAWNRHSRDREARSGPSPE